jgi:hypothetical protein
MATMLAGCGGATRASELGANDREPGAESPGGAPSVAGNGRTVRGMHARDEAPDAPDPPGTNPSDGASLVVQIWETPDASPLFDGRRQGFFATASFVPPVPPVPEGAEAFGPCVFEDPTRTSAGPVAAPLPAAGAIAIAGAHTPIELLQDASGFYGGFADPAHLDAPGDLLRLRVGGTTTALVVPSAVNLTAPACIDDCGDVRAGDLPLAWTGGTTGDVVVRLDVDKEPSCATTASCAASDVLRVGLTCTFHASEGHGTIPSGAIVRLRSAALPADPALATLTIEARATVPIPAVARPDGTPLVGTFMDHVTAAPGASAGGALRIH